LAEDATAAATTATTATETKRTARRRRVFVKLNLRVIVRARAEALREIFFMGDASFSGAAGFS
jgi:hypothetical protein